MGKRNRTTIRFTDDNYIYLSSEASLLGLSVDDIINVLIAALRRNNANMLSTLIAGLRQSDTKVTQKQQ